MVNNFTLEQQQAIAIANARRRATEAQGAVTTSATPATNSTPQDTSIGRTALDQGLQGATFGFSDEITDRLGAAIASLSTGENYNDLLKEARAASKSRMAAQFEERPGLSIGANLAGGLLTGVAASAPKALIGAVPTTGIRGAINVIPKAGTALGHSLRTGNLAARMGKGAVAGAASGGLYGAGMAEEGERLKGAERGAILGGVFGGTVPVIGTTADRAIKGAGAATTGITARGAEELTDLASNMKAAAGSTRERMRQIGAKIAPNRAQELAKNIDDALKGTDLIPELMPKTAAIVSKIREAATEGIELNRLDQYRRLLRVAGNEDTVAAQAVRKAIDSTVNNLKGAQDFTHGGQQAVKLLNQFRKEWTQASKFEDIAEILIKAKGDANKIKAGLTKFVSGNDNLRGYNLAEIAALKQAANTTKPEWILKGLGRFGLTPQNVFMPFVGGSLTAYGAGGPAGAALVGTGTMARGLQTALARGKAEQVLRLIEGTPNAAIVDQATKKLPHTTGVIPSLFEGQSVNMRLP